MFKQACLLCKIVGVIAIIGLLNYGAIGISHVNLIEKVLGNSPLVSGVYILFGISGLALLVSYFTVCPACKKS